MADTIDRIQVQFVVDTSKLKSGLKTAQSELGKTTASTERVTEATAQAGDTAGETQSAFTAWTNVLGMASPSFKKFGKTWNQAMDQIKTSSKGGSLAMKAVAVGAVAVVASAVAGIVSKVWSAMKELSAFYDPQAYEQAAGKLNRSIKKLKTSLGAITSVFTEAVFDKLADVVDKIAEGLTNIAKAFYLLKGLLNGYSDKVEETAEIVDETAAGLAGFDKLTTLDVEMNDADTVSEISEAYALGQELRKGITDWWNGIDWDGLWNGFVETFGNIGGYLGNRWADLCDTCGGLWQGFTETCGSIWEGLTSVLGGSWDSLCAYFGTVWSALTDTCGSLWSALISTFGGWWDSLCSRFGSVWKTLTDTCGTVWSGLTSVLGGWWSDLCDECGSIWQEFTTKCGEIWGGLKSTLTGVWNSLCSYFGNAWEGLCAGFGNIWDSLCSYFGNAWNSLCNWMGNIWSRITEPITSLLDRITSVFGGIGNALGSAWGTFTGWLGLAGGGVVEPNDPSLYVLGDNKREEEIVSPVSTMKYAMLEALQAYGGTNTSGRTEIEINLDGRRMARAIYDPLQSEARRRGGTA